MVNISSTKLCINLTEEDALDYLYDHLQRVFILIVVPCVTILGVFTNSAFLLVIYRVPNMRTPTNFYLANLSVADGVLLIVTTLNYVSTYIKVPVNYGYPFERVGCAISMWVIYVFSLASMAFVTLVAVERYHAVCRPLYYRQRYISSHPLYENMKLTIYTWATLIIIVAVPLSCVRVDYHCFEWPQKEPYLQFPSAIQNCKWPDWTWVFLDAVDILGFFTALLINVVVYIKIVGTLNKRQQPKVKARNHVARMLCINALVFFACLFPIQLSNIAEIHYLFTRSSTSFYGDTADDILLWIGRVAFLINSTINPIIYNICNPEYRKAFQHCIPFRLNASVTVNKATELELPISGPANISAAKCPALNM